MSDELLHWRVERNKTYNIYKQATIWFATSIALFAVGVTSSLTPYPAAATAAIGLLELSVAVSCMHSGYNRTFWNWWHDDSPPTHRPIEEWRDDLEDRGAFDEVRQYD